MRTISAGSSPLAIGALVIAGLLVGAGRAGDSTAPLRHAALPLNADTAIAFVGARILTMDRPDPLTDGVVVIRGGRIAAVGPRGQVDVPANARIVDAGGRYLIPGLFDMHVHLRELEAEPHLRLYVAHGVTTVQSMNGSPWHLDLRERLRNGDLLGPRMFTTGPTTASVGISAPEEARRLVREQKAAGYDAIKQYGDGQGTMDRELYAALMADARKAGMRVVGHAPRGLPFSVVLEEGQNSIDHMEEILYTSRAIARIFEPYIEIQFGRASAEDYPEVLEGPPDLESLEPDLEKLATEVRDAGLAVTPTLIAFGTIQDMTDEAFFDLAEDPRLRYIDPATRVQWGPGFNRYRTGGWSDKLELMAAVLEASHRLQMQLTGAFHRAGVPIMAGTDAPLPFVFPGSSLHEELELLVASGLTAREALRAATVVPARFLGIQDRTGTITVGKDADLVLLEANPLDDIRNTTRIAGVMVRGRWLARSELDGMLADIAEPYQARAKRIDPLARALADGEAEQALELYATLEDAELASFVERSVNTLGYRHLQRGDVDGAIRIFTLNTEYFPDAFNTWDSLAEAHMARGDDELAIEYYRKSLELNPSNENARNMIRRIRDRQATGGP